MPRKEENKTIARNRKAYHDYEIEETFEAGIELTGTEVRSLRDNNCQLTDCFALIRGGEVWLHGVHIPPFKNGNLAFNIVEEDIVYHLNSISSRKVYNF